MREELPKGTQWNQWNCSWYVIGLELEATKCLLKKSNQCMELPPGGRGYNMNSGRLQFQTRLCMGELSHFVSMSTGAQTQPSAEKTENNCSMQFFINKKIDIFLNFYFIWMTGNMIHPYFNVFLSIMANKYILNKIPCRICNGFFLMQKSVHYGQS